MGSAYHSMLGSVSFPSLSAPQLAHLYRKEIPEPETPILVLSSLGLLGFLKCRRKERPIA